MARSRTAKQIERRERYRRATGVEAREAQLWLLDQLINCFGIDANSSQAERHQAAEAALSMLEAIGPNGGIEGMLAVQMVAVQAATLRCLQRASVKEQTLEVREHHLRQGAALMGVYARQVVVLGRLRRQVATFHPLPNPPPPAGEGTPVESARPLSFQGEG